MQLPRYFCIWYRDFVGRAEVGFQRRKQIAFPSQGGFFRETVERLAQERGRPFALIGLICAPRFRPGCRARFHLSDRLRLQGD